MEYTEAQKVAFKHEFAARRKRQIMLAVPVVALVIIVAMFADERNGRVVLGIPAGFVGPAFLTIMVAAVAFSFRNWRCPACDKYLGKGMSPRFCPKCGVALQ
jgi:hypothetical protein